MAFRNPAVAGLYLVRAALRSPDYVLGTTGWSVNRDGTAEFNQGTFRGSIEVGPTAGVHFVVNNTATGDVWDVYDATGDVVALADANGDIATINWNLGTQNLSLLARGEVEWRNISATNVTTAEANGVLDDEGLFQGVSLTLSAWDPSQGTPPGGFVGSLQICGQGTATSGNAPPTVIANERGTYGSVAVTDGQSTNNRLHMASYSGTTDASGKLTIPHHAAFTPSDAVITGTAHGGAFANLTWGYDGADATNFTTNWTVANTGATWASRFITFSALFWG